MCKIGYKNPRAVTTPSLGTVVDLAKMIVNYEQMRRNGNEIANKSASNQWVWSHQGKAQVCGHTA